MEGEIANQPILSLPAPWYRDAGIHERERQAIFRREWHLLGHLGALAGPGDFIAGDIAGWAVFVIRDLTPAAERAMATTRAVVEEDFPICEAVQRSLESGLYQGGPLSPRHEAGIVMFHSLVRAAVGV
jgi:phenylpropionate dioxygenase-like ring-hydroxylating dioxygenase large terminal subunit